VIDAWTGAFPQAPLHARLTLKVSGLDTDRATSRQLQDLVRGRDDIRLVTEQLDGRTMDAFVAAFDVLISLHRAEGFGLTLAEAMAAGVAVIATDWSGNTDFMTADNSWPVAAGMTPVHDPDGPYMGLEHDPEQVWAEPEPEAAIRALRDLTASPALRAALGAGAIKSAARLDLPWRREALVTLPFNAWL
jgi:glycosyltransferase involved in cell wall biosynthesis